MTIHKCERCSKEFSRLNHLQKHLDRKRPCVPEDSAAAARTTAPCPLCGKQFKHDSNLCQHKKTCKGPKISVEQQILQLQQEVARLSAVGSSSVTNVDNSVHDNSTHITNVNITLNNYGSESQEHLESLSYADLKKVLKLTPDHECLIRMISFIHLNEAVPQNRTIRLDDKDSSVINVFKRGRWREQNADAVLYDLICRNRLRFVDLEEVLSKNMAKGKFQELTQYLCKAEDMANSENAQLHLEYAFDDLMSLIREKIAV